MVHDEEQVIFATWPEKKVQPYVNYRRRKLIASGVLVALIVILSIVLGVTLSRQNKGSSGGAPSLGANQASLAPVAINFPLLPTKAPLSTPNAGPTEPSLNSSNVSPIRSNSTMTPPGAHPANSPTLVNQTKPVSSTPAPTSHTVENVIRNVALFRGREFKNATYQLQALNWLKANASLSMTDAQLVQRYALACIFYATYAVPNLGTNLTFGNHVAVPGWNVTTGWVTDMEECGWYGITCNSNHSVIAIDLSGNNITGTFPLEVTLLKDTLERLNLNNNLVLNVGDIGNAFLGLLTQLKYLYYGSTFFAYNGIPTVIGLLTNLVEYDCSYTVYYGPLQDEPFRNLTQLKYLDIEGNAYNSSIPSSISNLPNLRSFYAGNAYLSGSLDFIKGMKSINEMWLDQNPGLTGTIPPAIGNLTLLTSLSMTNCSLHGELPSEMGDMAAMEQMWLFGNHLNGTVPSSIGTLTSLQIFQIENNDITGTMPAAVCRDFQAPGNLTVLTADCAAGTKSNNKTKIQCSCCTCCGNKCDQRRVRRHLGLAWDLTVHQ